MSYEPDMKVADCVEWLDAMPAGSVDLAFVDPPFNLNYNYDDFKDKQKPVDYVRWCERWLKSIHRVLKPNGTLWVCSGDGYASFIDTVAQVGFGLEGLADKKARLFHRRAWVVWYYTFGMNLQTNFTKSHTHLFYYTKSKTKYVWNDDPKARHASARQIVYNDKRANPDGRLPDDTWFILENQIGSQLKPFDDIWIESRVAGTFKGRVEGQSCQMPEPILERIIRLCSEPGALVIDCFLGSGVTCKVAQQLARRSAGCDISPTSIERARKLCGVT